MSRPISAETDGLKVTLTPDGTALVYIACPDAPRTEADGSELGKRRERPEEDVWAAV
jgi:hypothetical protein